MQRLVEEEYRSTLATLASDTLPTFLTSSSCTELIRKLRSFLDSPNPLSLFSRSSLKDSSRHLSHGEPKASDTLKQLFLRGEAPEAVPVSLSRFPPPHPSLLPSTAHVVLQLQESLDLLPCATILCDKLSPGLPIVAANKLFLRLCGFEMEDVIGYNCREVLQGVGTEVEPVRCLSMAIRNGETCHVQLKNYRKDGSSFTNQESISPNPPLRPLPVARTRVAMVVVNTLCLMPP